MTRGRRVWLWALIGAAVVLVLVLYLAAQTLVSTTNGGGGGQGPVTTVAEADTTTEQQPATTGEEESVEDFIVRLVETQQKKQWGRIYDDLHPAQQKFITPNDLAECFGQFELPPGAKVEVVEVYDEPWQIPGTKVTAGSKAVTVNIFMEYEEGGDKITSDLALETLHAYSVDGEWKWIVSQDTVKDIKYDLC